MEGTAYNGYGWSYCNIDEGFFTKYRPNSHETNPDSGETLTTDCTIFEHLSVNYPNCQSNAPGFISLTGLQTPTEVAATSTGGFLTQMA
jgi:hypothetical protein